MLKLPLTSVLKQITYIGIHIFSPPNDITAEQMFKIYDKNDDGFITCDEVKKLMLTFGENLSDAEANEFIKKKDKDGDGKINFEEWFDDSDDRRSLLTEEEATGLKEVFEEIDVDGKGTITFERMVNQLKLFGYHQKGCNE